MAFDRYRDDDRTRDRLRDDERAPDRDAYRDRDRGFFRSGRDDRDPASRREDARDRFARTDRGAPVPTDETRDLIASSKVEGTPVYGRDDQRLGTIKTLMLDKYRGQVRYAVLSHATGFLGMDQQHFPVQWDELRYDEQRGGYRVDFTSEDVRYTLERRQRERADPGRDIDRDWRR
ncbi:hypothetical protein GCM10022281_18080 [Sphingomonas rosea]|uniref:PRC-barrel domain-containing protein n=1 Tax=Sphingomonas rosea TaxID=335605 RepID=A0ABP7U8K2_9SPHN